MKYHIRPMTEDDINDVVKGEEEIFKTSLGYDMIYTDINLNPYAYYFVLEIDAKISGYIGLWIEDQAQIINFYVDKKYQNKGFGSMILKFVIELCIMSKVNNISLEVRESNIKAINLYEKYGFVKSYKRNSYYEDGEDAIVMIRNFEVEK